MLELDACCKTYRIGAFGGSELLAVSNVSFGVGPGEVVALIGESGSGKSTIGRMILRLLRVDRGLISFDGVDIATLGQTRAEGLLRPGPGRLPGSVQLVATRSSSRTASSRCSAAPTSTE